MRVYTHRHTRTENVWYTKNNQMGSYPAQFHLVVSLARTSSAAHDPLLLDTTKQFSLQLSPAQVLPCTQKQICLDMSDALLQLLPGILQQPTSELRRVKLPKPLAPSSFSPAAGGIRSATGRRERALWRHLEASLSSHSKLKTTRWNKMSANSFVKKHTVLYIFLRTFFFLNTEKCKRASFCSLWAFSSFTHHNKVKTSISFRYKYQEMPN